MRLIYITTLLVLSSFSVYSQFGLKGRLIDNQEKIGIIGAAVRLTSSTDTTKTIGVFTDIEGIFQLKSLEKGIYSLQITYTGYQTIRQKISIQKDENMGDILFQAENKLLNEVIVQGRQVRAEQKGDTVQYNADAYKVNKDASAEELLTKIPGITTQNGRVEAQGEAVRRVTVDGQEYFGDDASAALKNLPAEIIAKVEVFDRLSDQAQFSGVNDGNTEKAINIVTKSGKNNGQFGKFYGGYGTDDRFAAGGNVNYFKKARRISLIGLSNNVNIQNFANEDILEAMGGGNQMSQRFRGGGGNNDFFVAPSNGITRTYALGLNYSDAIGKKLKYSTSIFINDTKNNVETSISRLLLLPNQTNQLYEQESDREGINANSRINARIEYSPNRKNQFIITPRISFQSNATSTQLVGKNSLQSDFLSQLTSEQTNESNGNSVNGSILYNHRFEKAGRTVSFNTTLSNSVNQSNALLLSENLFANAANNQDIDQETRSTVQRNGLSARVEYNEPLSKQSQLQLGYEKSWSFTDSDRKTFDKEQADALYTRLNIPLSNEFMSDYNLDKGSVSYRYNKGRTFNANFSLAAQKATLTGDQTFPFAFDVNRDFFNLLPNAFVRYAISPQKNIRFFYRTSANAPTITQLQRVINNSNPLQLRTGNPDLDQE
ncbi:MAG: outer membrane beta-barrel protein, partial [Spirosomataceae bacterium]